LFQRFNADGVHGLGFLSWSCNSIRSFSSFDGPNLLRISMKRPQEVIPGPRARGRADPFRSFEHIVQVLGHFRFLDERIQRLHELAVLLKQVLNGMFQTRFLLYHCLHPTVLLLKSKVTGDVCVRGSKLRTDLQRGNAGARMECLL
jgi:hypothetical protein